MENICSELLDLCLRGEDWPGELLDRALQVDRGRAFFSVVVERLGDLFEPRLCEVYRRLFAQVIERVCPDLVPRIQSHPVAHEPPASTGLVYVLSRVTLGADVAVTSVLIDAMKKRYPEAKIVFVGSHKGFELFEADPRVEHFPAPYTRGGTLADRLEASGALWFSDGIVIDPDSRLSQLGVLSLCEPQNYFFFESRAYGADSREPLPWLAGRWANEIFGIDDASPFIAPLPIDDERADITVSLGVGENPAKRIGGPFERDLLAMLDRTGSSVLVDKGGSAEEHLRVERALQPGMRTHDGAFAPFAAHIARSSLYVGYDSSGQHVASACGVPSIAIFKGFVSERMLDRWTPPGAKLIRGDQPDVLDQVRAALTYTSRR